MKKRRLLAFVLCLAMLFSDATSTLASTMSDGTVVVTDTSEETEVADTETTEAEVPDSDVTGTEEVVTSTETTEEVASTESTEATETPEGDVPGETTEVADTTEVVEETEVTEITEEVEPVESTTGDPVVAVRYMENGETVASIGSYVDYASAMTGIENYLAENTGLTGEIHIALQADADFSGTNIAIDSTTVRLVLEMNGYTLTTGQDTVIRADIHSPDSADMAKIVMTADATLTILPFNPADENSATNLQNIEIVFNNETPIGHLIVGEQYDESGALTKGYIRLNDVWIKNAQNVTFEGRVGYDCMNVEASAIPFYVGDTLTIANANDDENSTWQYFELFIPTTCENLVWSGQGEISDIAVANKLTASAGSNLKINTQLTVKDIYATAGSESWENFVLSNRYLHDADNNFVSKATIEITGTITGDEGMDYPVTFQKNYAIQRSETDADGNTNSWIEDQGGFAYEIGEVIATAPSVEVTATHIEQWESSDRLLVTKNADGQLIAEKVAVGINLWDPESSSVVKDMNYASWEDAMAGITTDFANMSGQYNIGLYGDVQLTEDIVFPDYVERLCMNHMQNWYPIFDEEGNYVDGYEEALFVEMDFNGHSITVNGDIEWSEGIAIRNSASDESEIYINAEAIEWTEETEGYDPVFRINWIGKDMSCVDVDGNPVDRTAKYTWIDGVNIRVPNGRVELQAEEGAAITRIINSELTVARLEAQVGTWEITSLTTVENGGGTFINQSAAVTVMGTTTMIGGNGIEVRGELTLNDVVVKAHSEDPYANMWVEIGEVYNRDNDNEFLSKGTLIFAGAVTAEGLASNPVHIDIKEIYQYHEHDEEGNPLYEDEEQTVPRIAEEHNWEVEYASGEILAYVKSDAIDGNMFATNDSSSLLEIEGEELKVYKAVVNVDIYIEEEDRGISYRYRTLEEALENMEEDFGGRETNYTISFLDDVTLSEDIVVPSFVTNLRLQSEWRWMEHYDEEGNPIRIYDEEGNEIGIEGHNDIYFVTLDLNGHTITSEGTFEMIEGLQVVSKAAEKGGIISTATTGGNHEVYAAVNIQQVTDANFVDAEGNGIERNETYQWTFLDNVDVIAENGVVQLWSAWPNYTVNGDIIANAVCVRGDWTVDNITTYNELVVEESWYDEETDNGEPDGYLTVEKLTTTGGYLNNYGRLVVKNTLKSEDTRIINMGTLIAEKAEVPSGAFYNYRTAYIKDAEITRFGNMPLAWISDDDPETEEDEGGIFEWVEHALFICDTFTQPSDGITQLNGCSSFIVNESAEIYNLNMAGAYRDYVHDPANIYRMPDATIQINGEIVRQEDFMSLCFGILELAEGAAGFGIVEVVDTDEEGNVMGTWFDVAFVDADGNEVTRFGEEGWPVQTLQRDEVLFTTDIAEFPAEWICYHQNEEGAQYWSAYQMEDKVLVGGNWIIVSSLSDGYQEYLKEFSVWSEATEYIDNLSNANIAYVIELTDDIDTYGPLTLPAKAVEVIVRGASDRQIELTYEGDLSLSTTVNFENIKLNAVNSNGTSYASVVQLNGKTLRIVHSAAHFDSITGGKTSGLSIVDGAEVTVDKAVSTLLNVEMLWNGKLIVGTDFTGIEEMYMHSSTLEAGGKITVKDILSYDNKNKIIYSDNAENILTITGNITGPSADDENCWMYAGEFEVTKDNSFNVTETDPAVARVRASAIDITVKSLSGKYKAGDVLVNAPNVAATWFVVGSQYDEETGERTSSTSLTHKDGTSICYGGATTKAVELQIWDSEAMSMVSYDSYETLQEAFSEIDSIGNKDAIYYIVLNENVEIASLTTPKKARQVQIASVGEAKTITYDKDMKLNCHLLFENVILAPQSPTSKISLGNYALDLLVGTKLADGCKIASVTGSGVNKDSAFDIHDTTFTISGDIKNVGAIWLQSAELYVEGAINVGDIVGWIDTDIPEETRMQPTLIGTAKVTRKDGVVTKVDPQITISGEMWYDWSDVYIALQEKQADGTYALLNFQSAEMANILADGIKLAKIPKISSMMLWVSKKNNTIENQYITTKANGYLVVRKQYTDFGVLLGYIENDMEIWTRLATVADAVTEINNLNTKRAYEIILLSQTADISLKAPTTLKMSNAKAIESLKISTQQTGTGTEIQVVDLHYTGNITFTSDVILENVNLVQVAKVNGAYVSVNTQKSGYPSPVTVSTGGNDLTIEGKVTFNTPIKLDGKKKGTLNVNGELTTKTNESEAYTKFTSYACGSIKNFSEVNINNTLYLFAYGTASKDTVKYTAAEVNVTTLNVTGAQLIIGIEEGLGKLTTTNLNAIDGSALAYGDVKVTNAMFDGISWLESVGKMNLKNVELNGAPGIVSYKDFTISGTLTCNTEKAVFKTLQKSGNKNTPYLNITGKVVLGNPETDKIQVGVWSDFEENIMPEMKDAPNASGMLLTAKTATADMFVPYVTSAALGSKDNVGGKGAYSAENPNGYILMKVGSGIYVYYGDEIAVELSKAGEVLGYYNNLKDTAKAIDAINDKEAVYTITLLNDAGTEAEPVAMTMPKKAEKVIVQSSKDSIYFEGNITLSASTALALADTAVITGNVKGKGFFEIGQNITVTVGGTFAADNVTFNGGNVLDAQKNTVTIGTIVNNGSSANKIIYGKNSKGITNLTIKGWVSGDNSNAILLQLISDTDKASYVLDSVKGKVVLDSKQKIATIEKAALSSFEVMINEETFYIPDGEPRFSYQLVKANKGVYHVDIDTDPDWLGTWLEFTKDGKTYVTCCLDFAQAVNEINTLADKETDYIINICRRNTTIWDTNLSDNKYTSPITMPKANVANSVTIAYSGFNDWQRGIEFTGNISYAGNLGFRNCEITATNISNVKTLTLDNTAFVTTGTVKVTDVVVKGNTTWDAFGKTTIANLDATEKGSDSYLASKQTTAGVPTFTINGDVTGQSVWKAIRATATADSVSGNRYIGDYKNASLVIAKAAGADKFIAYPYVNISDIVSYKDTKNAVKNGVASEMKVMLTYEDNVTYAKSYEEAVKLIDNIGNKEGRYTIQFLTGGTKENPAEVTTKDGAYGALTFPKKAAYVAIRGQIDEAGNPSTVLGYTGKMQPNCMTEFIDILLTEGTVTSASGKQVFTPSYSITPAFGSKYFSLVFGKNVATQKAEGTSDADLVINSISGSKGVVRFYNDARIKESVKVLSMQVLGDVTVSVGKDISASTIALSEKATVEVSGKATAKMVSVFNWEKDVADKAVLDVDKAITITDVTGPVDADGYATGDGLRIVTNRTESTNETQLTVNGQITDVEVDVAMNVYDTATGKYREMTVADAAALLVTEEDEVPTKAQKIVAAPKASSENVNVVVKNGDDWVTFEEISSEEPEAEPIRVTTYKQDGGIYISNLPTLLMVFGNNGERMTYNSSFLNWEQAVKEIDKVADKNANYVIELLRNVGQDVDGTMRPLKNVTLPSKAKQVIISGNNIFFTGTKITAKTNMVFTNIGLMAVKQVTEARDTWYESTSYDVNIGNYYVVMDNITAWTETYDSEGNWTGSYDNMPGTISGSKKGHFEFYRGFVDGVNNVPATMIKGIGTVEFWDANHSDTIDFENVQGYAYTNVPEGITGVENLILHPFVYLESLEGAISVKNVDCMASNIVAKNLTVTGTAELESAWLVAGTDIVGDGIIKLANVVLNGYSGLSAKQDKNGKSLIQITGKVSVGEEYEGETEGMLQIELRYNDDSTFAQLYDGMLLLTAPKADASWFVPAYSWSENRPLYDENGDVMYDEDGNMLYEQEVDEEGNPIVDEEGNPVYAQDVYPCMGWPREGYGLYKSGKAIYYGSLGM